MQEEDVEIRDELREKLLSSEESGGSDFNRRETIKKSNSGLTKVDQPLDQATEAEEGLKVQPKTMKPAPIHKHIDRETIFPSRLIERKKEELMKKSKKKSFWACFCPYLKDKKVKTVLRDHHLQDEEN